MSRHTCYILGFFGICLCVALVTVAGAIVIGYYVFSLTRTPLLLISVGAGLVMFGSSVLWLSLCWMSDKCDREAGCK